MAWFCSCGRDPSKLVEEGPSSSPAERPRPISTEVVESSVRSSQDADPTTNEMLQEGMGPTPCQELTRKMIYEFVFDYMEEFTRVANGDMQDTAWSDFWGRRHTADYLHMRPSGNALDLNGARNMFESGDICDFTESVLAVESIKILGRQNDVAVVVFKSEHEFTFKGKQEDGLSSWTFVIVLDETTSTPKVTNIHRCVGKRIDAVR